MSSLRLPRATAASIDAQVLEEGEVVHDTTNDEIRLGDGSTAGGKRLITNSQSSRQRLNASPFVSFLDEVDDDDTREAILDYSQTDDLSDTMQTLVDEESSICMPPGRVPIADKVEGGSYSLYGDAAFIEALYPYGQHGSVLYFTGTTNSPFELAESVSFEHLTFQHYQPESTTAPIVYPPVFVNDSATTTVAGLQLEDINVFGAYDFVEFGGTSAYEKAGQLQFESVRAFVLRRAFNITNIPDTITFASCDWGYDIQGDDTQHYGAGGAGGILTVTSITRSGTTATVTTATAHGRSTGSNVTIAGADQSAYNITNAEITVTGATTFTYQVSGSPATPATGTIKCHVFGLREFHRDNAVWMRVYGNGTVSGLSTYTVDGVTVSNSNYLGQKAIFELAADPDGGLLQIVNFHTCFVDQVQHLLLLRAGSACYTFNVSGVTGFQDRTGDSTWFGYFIDIEDPAPGPSTSTFTEINLSDTEMGYMRGGLATITGDYVERVSITGFSCPVCIHTTENGDRSFIVIDAPNADVILHVNRVTAANTATGTRTFCEITNARSVDVRGVFDNWDCVIENNSATAKVSFDGKTFNDGDDAIQGTYAGNVKVSQESAIDSMPTVSNPASENALINPAFDINQRGTSFASGAIAYTSDRWKATRGSAAAGATFSRQTGFSGAQFCYRLARDNGNSATDILYFAQQIETASCYQYQGGEFYVGFDARAGANFSASGGTLSVTVHTGTGSNETVNVATGFATGNVSQTKTATLTTTAQHFVLGPFDIASGVTEIAVVVSWTPVGTAGAADYAEVTRFSAGNLPTAQVYRPRAFRDELNICEAYFEKSFNLATAPAQNVGASTGETRIIAIQAGATANAAFVPFRIKKRTSSTVTLYNPAASNGQARDLAVGADCSSTSVTTAMTSGFVVATTGNASTAIANNLAIHWIAEAEIGP